MERKCQMCGAVFPEGTPASRKYCYDCLEKRKQEAQIRHRDKEREKARQRAEIARQSRPATVFNKANRDYCSKCIYCGSFTEGYLCDYNLKTRLSRRCKPGVGCNKRETMDGKRRCDRCGRIFEVTGRATLCDDCRRQARAENARRVNERRWANGH